MPIITRKLGPGILELGDGALAVQAQLTACKLTSAENVESTDAVTVLSMETLEGDERVTHTHALEGNVFQDQGSVASVVQWSWDTRGTPQTFSFTPNEPDGTAVTGILVPVPLQLGGDAVNERMASDFTWRLRGTPDIAWGGAPAN